MHEDRPAGATILSLLHMAGGALILAGTFYLVSKNATIPTPLIKLAVPQWFVIVWLTLFGIWSLGAGIELWITRNSGWHLITAFYLHLILQVAVLLIQAGLKIDYVVSFSFPVILLLCGVLLISGILYAYFWHREVVESYDMESTGMLSRLMPSVIVGVLLVIAAHAGYRFFGSEPVAAPPEVEVGEDPYSTSGSRLLERTVQNEQEAMSWLREALAASVGTAGVTLPRAQTLAAGPDLWAMINTTPDLDADAIELVPISTIATRTTEEVAISPVLVALVKTPKAQSVWWRATLRLVSEQQPPIVRAATPLERHHLSARIPLDFSSKPLIILEGDKRIAIAFRSVQGINEAYFIDLLPSDADLEPGARSLPEPSPEAP